MKKNYKRSVLFILFILFLSITDQAQNVVTPGPGLRGSWRLLGITEAKYSIDHDIIYIKGPFDYFRKLKFKVTDAPLHMIRMIVSYDDGGSPESIELRQRIPEGGESRVIDLSGGKRKLKSVQFWYSTRGFLRGKADVILYGIK